MTVGWMDGHRERHAIHRWREGGRDGWLDGSMHVHEHPFKHTRTPTNTHAQDEEGGDMMTLEEGADDDVDDDVRLKTDKDR